MAQDDPFGAPAGWYPDPLGLPQLRWWNNHAWTEQTSAARQPIVMQDTKFAWADDELPTRREERERERLREERRRNTPAEPTAATLRELAPPRAFTKVDDFPTPPVDPYGGTGVQSESPLPSFDSLFDGASTTRPFATGTSTSDPLDDPFGIRSGGEPQYETRRSTARAGYPGNARTGAAASGNTPLVSTAPAWIIAMIPLFQLVLSLLLLTALGMGSNATLFIGILTVPYLIVIALAYADFRMLKKQGVERPAHWTWSFLTAPVYLLARARSVIRESGHGTGPVLVWFGLGALHLASVIAIPGLLIAILPAMFTSQLEASVEGDALLISGASMSVSCPATPPVIFGEQTVCTAISSSGNSSEVAVRLERANGWIEWQVLDWGVWDMEK
ncbi:hypothetical protein GCM10027413_22370 [Conyzicola nivalis]|uniref:DUF2510 domain-containing protein n=1 Tax=Conyzicola nivalis TaxID=1477021 RepID=A0A916SDV9_9MICO|nr:DUF2510 domain-containing protein [Conyzicola nivalis]GGA92828.1 hypothetical protein GCM10010979_04250 [Conyzicola nivalis]